MENGKWKTAFFLLLLLAPLARAAEPSSAAWIINQSLAARENKNLARVWPEVHSVTLLNRYVEAHSSGVSLYFFGPFQTPVNPVDRLRQFRFRLPRRPAPETGARLSVRPDIIGVFVNGSPIYNLFEAESYRGQNLWRFDTLARSDDGTWTASGHPRAELQHGFASGLLERLIADASQHSPIIGYAFDGYPIYGPWGFANADGSGGLRRLRSSYRLREIKRRTQWPDGLELTPGQHGPEVGAEFPLGSFVEDYEYAPGAGDLDEFNGRFTVTPEYPAGTYAYFLSTDASGRLAFPYLLARRYYGKLSVAELKEAVRDLADGESDPTASRNSREIIAPTKTGQPRLSLMIDATVVAGRPARLSFQARDARGAPVRSLEYVHERPLHLIVVSDDLAEFAHIHPELVAGDRYEVTHTFERGGRYRLYADFTPPGFAQRVESFDITVAGPTRKPEPLVADTTLTKETCGLRLSLTGPPTIHAAEDVELKFAVRDAATGGYVADLEPYLGAWAHFIIIDQQRQSFIHAHPLEAENAASAPALTQSHIHGAGAQPPGPPPAEIRALTSLPKPGLYKLWAQFQRAGQVITQPFTIRVAAAKPRRPAMSVASSPASAIEIKIGPRGFEPASLKLSANQPVKLVVTRDSQPNCGNRIVFPALGLTRDLPLGGSVVIELPALAAGELRFTCGMGMYKGLIVIQ
jgi:hypothetical protein